MPGAWNYNPAVRTDLNRVREIIGDVDSSDKLISDEIIAEKLVLHSNDLKATAIACLELVVGLLYRQIDQAPAGFQSSRSQKFDQALRLLDRLKESSVVDGGGNSMFYFGGLEQSEHENLADEAEALKPRFKVPFKFQ